jgi:hypothetical protein
MKKYYVYKVVDSITGEFYIGSRGTNSEIELDIYMGSPYVWKPKIENLKKEIIKDNFNSMMEAINFERETILKFINDPLNRNYCIPHPKISREGLITAKNIDSGKVISISKQDPLFGKLYVGVTKGMVVVKDKDGNRFYCEVDNPKYIAGEYSHVATGMNVGADHQNWGKVWINNGIKQKLILESKLKKLIDSGWKQGTLQKGKTTNSSHIDTIWVNKEGVNKRINSKEFESYKSKGFNLGRSKLKKYEKRKK